MHNISLKERKRDFYLTGIQDCDNVFDGDDVPTADDLREAFDACETLDEADVPHAAVLRAEWVRGWLECAAAHVEADARRRAQLVNE